MKSKNKIKIKVRKDKKKKTKRTTTKKLHTWQGAPMSSTGAGTREP